MASVPVAVFLCVIVMKCELLCNILQPGRVTFPHKRSVEPEVRTLPKAPIIKRRRTNRLFKRFLARQKFFITEGQSVTYRSE